MRVHFVLNLTVSPFGPTTMKFQPLILCTFVLSAAFSHLTQAQAGVIFNISGEAGSDIVTVSVSGAGTWTRSGVAGTIGALDFNDFVSFQSLPKGSTFNPTSAPIISGNITFINHGKQTFSIERLSIIDGDTQGIPGFNAFGLETDVYSFVEGLSYSISGTATFSLSTLGLNATYDDLNPGTYNATNFFSSGFGAIEAAQLTVQPPSSGVVPEPASLSVWGIGLLGLSLVRRRKA